MEFVLTDENWNKARFAGEDSFISENGAYKGIFENVYMTTSVNGNEFVNFNFTDEDGRKSNFNLCVQGADGKEYFGANIVRSIMRLVGAPKGTKLTATPTTVMHYGKSTPAMALKGLTRKPIGVLLQKRITIDETSEKKENWNMVLLQAFDAKTGKTLDEIESGKEAKTIQRRAEKLEDVVVQRKQNEKYQAQNHSQPVQQKQFDNYAKSQNKADDFGLEEDVPF